jgi:hypothetical protein
MAGSLEKRTAIRTATALIAPATADSALAQLAKPHHPEQRVILGHFPASICALEHISTSKLPGAALIT